MNADHEIVFDFDGTGFILTGAARARNARSPDYIFQTEVWLDGKKIGSPDLPTDFTTRRLEVAWKYPLPKGKHSVRVKVLNPDDRYEIRGLAYIVYSDAPARDPWAGNGGVAAESPAIRVSTYVYKRVGADDLKLDVFAPDSSTGPLPVIVLFHGGSWISGDKSQLNWQCHYFAQQGIEAVTANYRLLGRDTGIVDARSAIRWIVGHARRLNIDADRIILGGASAGGHLATMALLSPGHNDPADDLSIPIAARALVLFNPAYSLTDNPAVEPFQQGSARLPPAIFFYGSRDKWKPAGDSLRVILKKAGRECDGWVAEGQVHGFFNKAPWNLATCVRAQEFLASLGLMARPAGAAQELIPED
jgi:acetyl esterase/lipase